MMHCIDDDLRFYLMTGSYWVLVVAGWLIIIGKVGGWFKRWWRA